MVSLPTDDEVIVIKVEGLAERRGPYEEARQLYTDLTRSKAWSPLTPALASF